MLTMPSTQSDGSIAQSSGGSSLGGLLGDCLGRAPDPVQAISLDSEDDIAPTQVDPESEAKRGGSRWPPTREVGVERKVCLLIHPPLFKPIWDQRNIETIIAKKMLTSHSQKIKKVHDNNH